MTRAMRGVVISFLKAELEIGRAGWIEGAHFTPLLGNLVCEVRGRGTLGPESRLDTCKLFGRRVKWVGLGRRSLFM